MFNSFKYWNNFCLLKFMTKYFCVESFYNKKQFSVIFVTKYPSLGFELTIAWIILLYHCTMSSDNSPLKSSHYWNELLENIFVCFLSLRIAKQITYQFLPYKLKNVGLRTLECRMEGRDESTEPWQPCVPFYFESRVFLSKSFKITRMRR